MRVLVGCEESQIVCGAFRAAGHEAYSCDLLPTRGNPDWHVRADVMDVLLSPDRWDLIILHPDCTAMAVSGNRWYGQGMPRHRERIASVAWTTALWLRAKRRADRVALENPGSVIFPVLRKAGAVVFYLQPHQHGHGETKKTGFALHGLDPLPPTNDVTGRENRIWKMPPSPTRKRDRSATYPGVAQAMVRYWGAE